MKNILYLILFAAMLAPGSLFALNSDSIVGVWKNEECSAAIKIYKENNKYCGKIIWLKEPINPETSAPQVDQNNPNRGLRKRKIVGLVIMKSIEFSGESWQNGLIYDPNNGRTYRTIITISADKQTLYIRGFIGISLFGRTAVWKRTNITEKQ